MLMIATSLIAASGELLKLETAVLFLVILGVLVLAKMVSDLRGEVRALRRQPPVPNAATVAPSAVPAALPATPSAPLAPAAPAPLASDEIPADVYAAIAAAVHYTLGQEYQTVSVTPAETMMWSREGRRNIFSSHTFR